MGLMESDQGADVDIAYAVAVGKTKGRVGFNVIGDPFEATAGHGVFTGVHQGHPPGFGLVLVNFHFIRGHVEGDIGHVQKIIGKVFLDQIALIAATDHEVIDSLARKNL